MGFAAAAWIIVLGVMGAANLIIARKPEAKPLSDKLAPYQGWFGASSALWGLWIVIWSIGWIGSVPLLGITALAQGLVLLGLGLLLGVGVLKSFIKQPQAQPRLDALTRKLAPYQGTLGFTAIGLGLWGLVVGIVW